MVQDIVVGLDVHARSVVASATHLVTGQVWEHRFSGDNQLVVDWVRGLPGVPRVVYEAGPTGYVLARALLGVGVDTVIAAPSKLLPVPGDRVKTDMRDARHLASLLAAGQVTAIRIPPVEEETARDLSRAREAARRDVTRAKHRVSKLLLRRGTVWDGTAWTREHLRWLTKFRFNDPILDEVLDTAISQLMEALDRRERLDKVIEQFTKDSPWTPTMIALGCLRGVSLITGFGLATEIGDWTRFTPTSIGAYLGLVPSEHSSGGKRHQGGITKTGNGHARILLVETAWHHRPTYSRSSPVLQARWAKAPKRLAEYGHQVNLRLHRRWVSFDKRGKLPVITNTAIARELAGYCWNLVMLMNNS